MNIVSAKLTGEVDVHGRPIAVDTIGNYYLDVSLGKNDWHCVTEEFEPLVRVSLILIR
jgi:hypothetical protein